MFCYKSTCRHYFVRFFWSKLICVEVTLHLGYPTAEQKQFTFVIILCQLVFPIQFKLSIGTFISISTLWKSLGFFQFPIFLKIFCDFFCTRPVSKIKIIVESTLLKMARKSTPGKDSDFWSLTFYFFFLDCKVSMLNSNVASFLCN